MSPPTTTLTSHPGRMSYQPRGPAIASADGVCFCTHASDVQRRLRRCWRAQAKRGRRVTALLRVWRPTEELQTAQEGDLLIASRLLALRRSAGRDRCATRGDTVWWCHPVKTLVVAALTHRAAGSCQGLGIASEDPRLAHRTRVHLVQMCIFARGVLLLHVQDAGAGHSDRQHVQASQA